MIRLLLIFSLLLVSAPRVFVHAFDDEALDFGEERFLDRNSKKKTEVEKSFAKYKRQIKKIAGKNREIKRCFNRLGKWVIEVVDEEKNTYS